MWLGIVWDGAQGVIRITESRIHKCLARIDRALSEPHFSARNLVSIVGKIISMSAVMQNFSSIMSRHFQISIAAAQDWDTPFSLDRYCIVELEFWRDNLRRANSRDVSSFNPPYISVFSDASDVACGGHILGTDIYAHRMLTVFERAQSSTYRELVAIVFVLFSLGQFMSGSRVKRFTDSQGAARIVQVGSMHFNLHNLASDIFSFFFNQGINLEIEWVPRSQNEKAN